jgi:acetoin utilization deacetylase AcuC-like enzyme
MTPESERTPFWRRLVGRALGRNRLDIVYSPDYRVALPTSAVDVDRGRRILSFLASQRLLRRRRFHRPYPASLRRLGRTHSAPYLDSLQWPGALLPVLGFEVDAKVQDAFLAAHRSMVGGTLLATRLARSSGGVAVNLGGGFHHARRDVGQGFCVFNDVAIAIAAEREGGFSAPVLVIDLDLHDGEGTRAIFADDDSVHTLSIHNRDLEPTDARASTSIALGGHVADRLYLETLDARLPEIVDDVRPGLIVYLAGTDPAEDDALGDWEITADGLLRRDLFVLEQARRHGRAVPVVVLLAGGYGQGAWRHTARFLARVLSHGQAIEPPETEELSLAEYRRIARQLAPGDLIREDADDGWSLTDEDVMGALGGASRSSRLLGYYSRHGVEIACERYGIFETLREKGFGRLRVEFDFEDPFAQTVRVLSDDVRTEPLVELRVRRDAVSIPGMELLRVEWLQLQNPRATFTDARPALPGQSYPGLGLLRSVVSMLVMACERLGLEGLVFTPSHYHLGVQSRKLLRFLEPRDEARFRAIREALGGLSLVEATRALEAGRVRDAAAGEAVAWTPVPMVLPVGEALRARMSGDSYETSVERHAPSFRYTLVPDE